MPTTSPPPSSALGPPPTANTPDIGQSIIDPGRRNLDVLELWSFRELFWIFATRDIKVRYKQTVLGGAWALIQPLGFTIVGSLLFRGDAKWTDNVQPTFLFFLVSQLPWMLFSTGLQTSSMSLVSAQNMIKKIYFPRLILPVSAVIVSLADFLVQLVLVAAVLLGLPVMHHLPRFQNVPTFFPPIQVLLLPLAALWAFLAALAIGVPMAALNVEYRDVRYIIPFVTQFMIFAAPVFWSVQQKITNVQWRAVYGLLPIAGPIDFFRWCVLDTPAHPLMWLVGLVSTILTLLIGMAYFRRVEDSFADVV